MPDKMSIKEIMMCNVLTVPPETTVREAVEKMARLGAGSVVITIDGKPKGILTERDLMLRVMLPEKNPDKVSVIDVMTKKLITLNISDTVEEAYRKMDIGKFRHVIVVDKGLVAGILSVKDLMKFRDQILQQRVEEKTREILQVKQKLEASLEYINREMATASRFQKDLVDKRHPRTGILRFSHVYEQAASLGGDFFEIAHIDKNHVGVLVADVMGHGITSAMISLELKMKFDQLHSRHLFPGDVVKKLNDQLIPLMPQGFFVAGFYCIIALDSLKIEYTQFGLPHPLLMKANTGRVVFLSHGNLPIGIQKGVKYESRTVSAAPGDTLLLFTDGCIEQRDKTGRLFGEKRFLKKFKELIKSSEKNVTTGLYKVVKDFAGSTPINDDIAILLCSFQNDK